MATADLRLTFGAMYIGCVISVSFSGIGTLQAYYYFRQFRKRDSRLMKSTVLSAWILDFVHTVFICQGIWHYLVLGWGNKAELDHLTWTVGASIAVTGLITIIVQMFFANRVWRLSKHNTVLTAVIVFVAFIRLGSALNPSFNITSTATTVQMIRLQSFKAFIRDFRWLFTFGLSLSCIIDVIITSSLCYYLQGNRTGYSSIDDVLHRLLLYTINNGLLTTFASMLAMVFAAAMPNNFLFLSLHFIIAKCYVNSLLATLNSRDTLKRRDDSHPMAVHISVDGPNSQPRFYKHQIPHVRSASGSNRNDGRTVPVSAVESIGVGQTSTIGSVKVHVNVEQTVHRDDGEIEVDATPEGSIKSPYLSSLGEKDHDTLDVVHLT